jgi:outer membrane biosynthesis protein TonB
VEALALEAEPAALDDDRLEMTSGRRRGRGSLRLPGAAAPLLRSGALRATVCVDRDGRPDHLEIDQGSGAAEVDRYVSRQLLSDRYQPLERDGRRMRFCERITVVFDRQT